MTSDQFYYIWSKLPKNPDGTVDYKDFLKIFSTLPDVSRAASATPPQSRDRRVRKHIREDFLLELKQSSYPGFH